MTTNDKTRMVDRWLDEGLKQYAQVMSREGLENRILANLRTQPHTSVYYWRWMPVLAGMIVIASLAIVWPKQAQPVIKTAEVLPQPVHVITPVPRIAQKNRSNSPPHVAVKSAQASTNVVAPKLDQFPSPRPLSQQEELLLAYVRQVPKEELKLTMRTDIQVEPLSVKNLDIPPLPNLEPGSDSNN
jgi:hypothetical protein